MAAVSLFCYGLLTETSAVSRLSVEQSSLKRFLKQCLSNRPLKQLTVSDSGDTTSSGRLFYKLTIHTQKKFARIDSLGCGQLDTAVNSTHGQLNT